MESHKVFVSGNGGMYDAPIALTGSFSTGVHFDEKINNSFIGMTGAQKDIAAALGEQTDIKENQLLRQVMLDYSKAVRELVKLVNGIEKEDVEGLLNKINESLRLFNFNAETFRNIFYKEFVDYDNFISSDSNSVEYEQEKEIYFCRKFQDIILQSYGLAENDVMFGRCNRDFFDRMMSHSVKHINKFLIVEYQEYTKKVNDLVSEVELIKFSNKTGLDIRINFAPDFFHSELQYRKAGNSFEPVYDDIQKFKLRVVLDDEQQYKLSKKYNQRIYEMNCSMEKLFNELGYKNLYNQRVENFDFENFFKEKELEFIFLEEKADKLHFSDDEVCVIAKDLDVILDVETLDEYNIEHAPKKTKQKK